MKQSNSKWTYLVGGVITMGAISSLAILGYLYLGWWSVLVTGMIVGLPSGYKVDKDIKEEEIEEILVDDWEAYGESTKH